YQAAQSNRLDTERLAMVEFSNCFIRRMHRNHADRGTAVCILSPGFSRVLIESMATRFAQFLITNIWRKQLAVSWIKHSEIQAHLFEPIVQQRRNKRGRHIEDVLDREHPPGWLPGAPVESLQFGHPDEITLAEGPET